MNRDKLAYLKKVFKRTEIEERISKIFSGGENKEKLLKQLKEKFVQGGGAMFEMKGGNDDDIVQKVISAITNMDEETLKEFKKAFVADAISRSEKSLDGKKNNYEEDYNDIIHEMIDGASRVVKNEESNSHQLLAVISSVAVDALIGAPTNANLSAAVSAAGGGGNVGANSVSNVDTKSLTDEAAELEAELERVLQIVKDIVKKRKIYVEQMNTDVMNARARRDLANSAFTVASRNATKARYIASSDLTKLPDAVAADAELATATATQYNENDKVRTAEAEAMAATTNKERADTTEWEINNAKKNLKTAMSGTGDPLVTVMYRVKIVLAMDAVREMEEAAHSQGAENAKYLKYKQKYLALKAELNM